MTRRIVFSLLFLAACDSGAISPGGGADMSPATPFPAFSPEAPQVVSQGGPVLAAPTVVAITFPNDPFVEDIETFVQQLGATSYWRDTTAEYGVGPLTALTSVRLTEDAPTEISDSQIQFWLRGKLDGTHPEFATPSANIIYAIFYPATTVISDGTQESCQSFGGYHSDTFALAFSQSVAYAVLPRCQAQPGLTPLDVLTTALSHELIEAVQDPYPQTSPSFESVDAAHYAWERVNGGSETADLCAQLPTAQFKPADFAYTVQRSWSNAAALAGHDPCVPAPDATPYFNATITTPPEMLTTQTIDTEGWTLTVGESRTFDVGLFSDAPTGGPWQVSAAERSFRGGSLEFAWDATQGENGTTLHLTVTAKAASMSRSGTSTFFLNSKLGARTNSWIHLIKVVAP